MSYLGEIRINWRFLTAASIGQAAGYSLLSYVSNIFTPQLISQFGWSRSDVALVGTAAFASILTQPVAGRVTDALGVKRMALIGVISTPLVLLGLAYMTGAFSIFFLLSLLQVAFLGTITTAPVYSRLIAYKFSGARGIALAIAACAPAAVAAAFVPLLSGIVDAHGWRTGYLALALYTALAGAVAVLLIPAGMDRGRNAAVAGHDGSRGYGAIFRSRAFQLIVAGFVLSNLAITMQTTQLKVIFLDRGIDSATGSLALSLYALSVLFGRICCGLALDRFPVYLVAACAMGFPGIGLLLLATGTSAPVLIAAAVLCMGLSFGAEGDLVAYVVMKFFRLNVYSSVLGLVYGALAISVSCGALLLGLTLKATGSFVPFMVLSGIAALISGGLFLLLRRVPAVA
jgi:MFS family permease